MSFGGAEQDELASRAHCVVLEMTSRDPGSRVPSSMMISQTTAVADLTRGGDELSLRPACDAAGLCTSAGLPVLIHFPHSGLAMLLLLQGGWQGRSKGLRRQRPLRSPPQSAIRATGPWSPFPKGRGGRGQGGLQPPHPKKIKFPGAPGASGTQDA